MPAFTSSALRGARDINTGSPLAFQGEDLGYKITWLISTVNALVTSVSTLNTAVSNIHLGLQQGMLCAASFASAFSTVALGSANATSTTLLNSYTGSMSNFRA